MTEPSAQACTLEAEPSQDLRLYPFQTRHAPTAKAHSTPAPARSSAKSATTFACPQGCPPASAKSGWQASAGRRWKSDHGYSSEPDRGIGGGIPCQRSRPCMEPRSVALARRCALARHGEQRSALLRAADWRRQPALVMELALGDLVVACGAGPGLLSALGRHDAQLRSRLVHQRSCDTMHRRTAPVAAAESGAPWAGCNPGIECLAQGRSWAAARAGKWQHAPS